MPKATFYLLKGGYTLRTIIAWQGSCLRIPHSYPINYPDPLNDPKVEPLVILEFAQCTNGFILGGSICWIL